MMASASGPGRARSSLPVPRSSSKLTHIRVTAGGVPGTPVLLPPNLHLTVSLSRTSRSHVPNSKLESLSLPRQRHQNKRLRVCRAALALRAQSGLPGPPPDALQVQVAVRHCEASASQLLAVRLPQCY
eukprot:207981-Rhodomonas_salina.5